MHSVQSAEKLEKEVLDSSIVENEVKNNIRIVAINHVLPACGQLVVSRHVDSSNSE